MRHRPMTFAVFALLLASVVPSATAQPTPTKISVPSSTTCDEALVVSVGLSARAPEGGVVVKLASSLPTVIAVPPSVTVPAGGTVATFKAPCSLPSRTSTATLTATSGGVSASAVVSVVVAELQSIALGASLGDGSAAGRVTLTAPAPANGKVVSLASSNPLAATVPASVTVPSAQTAATFTITTIPAAQSSTSTITATLGTVSKSATITVAGTSTSTSTDGTSNTISTGETQPTPLPATLASLVFDSGGIVASSKTITGGQSQLAKVMLDGVATGSGFSVVLRSANTAVAAVPASIVVPVGQSAATFTVTTFPVLQSTTVTITATAGRVARRADLTVTASTAITDGTSNTIGFGETQPPPVPASLSFLSGASTLISSATVAGGQSQQAKVTMDRIAGTSGASVSLRSSNPAVASVPSTILVPAGQNSATFTVTTFAVSQTSTVTITAVVGTVSRSASLGVTAPTATDGTSNTIGLTETQTSPVPASVTFQSSLDTFVATKTITGGQGQQARVTLNATAGGSGVSVALRSSNPAVATTPASVLVPAGQIAATFTITTFAAAQSSTVTISAIVGTASRSATLTVAAPTTSVTDGTSNTVVFTETKPAPASVTFQSATGTFVSPSTITGGQNQQTKVTLDKMAGRSGVTVALRSGNPAVATTPSSVVVPEGQTAAIFTVTTFPVSGSVAVTITATVDNASKTAKLTVVDKSQ